MSVGLATIERMFDTMDDVAVVDAITDAARVQSAMCARELAAIGELYARRAPADDADRFNWAVDGHENVVAEAAAALGISRGRAAGRLRYAIALRERLPRVAEVFAQGAIDFRLMAAVVYRTELIEDPVLIAKLDAAVARHAPRWMRLSAPKAAERIDMWVARFDPAGVRVPGNRNDDRYVEIGPIDPGLAGVWAKLHAVDGAALERKLDALAATVCRDDPRTKAQRRADALGALAAEADVLRCQCGEPNCAAAQGETGTNIVIHVLAEETAVKGDSQAPGYLPGFGPVPSTLLRDLAGVATVRPLVTPRARPGVGLSAFGGVGRIRPISGSNVPIPRVRPAGRGLRHRPHRAVSARSHPPVEPQAPLPLSPSVEDVLQRVARSSGAGWNRGLDVAVRPHLHHETFWSCPLSGAGHPDRDANAAHQHAAAWRKPRSHDAGPTTNSGRGPRRAHQLGAWHQRSPNVGRSTALLERPCACVGFVLSVELTAEVVSSAGEQDVIGFATPTFEGVGGGPAVVAHRSVTAGRGPAPIGFGARRKGVDVADRALGGDQHRASPMAVVTSVGARPESGVVRLACQRPAQQAEGRRKLRVSYRGGSRDELSRVRAVDLLDVRIAEAGQLLRDAGVVTAADDRSTPAGCHRGQRDAGIGGCGGRPGQSTQRQRTRRDTRANPNGHSF